MSDGNQVVETAATTGWDLLYVAGADPAKKFPHNIWSQAKFKFLVVQDLFLTETAKQADVVLPTLSYVEKEGHFMNIAGHIQTLRPGKPIPEHIYSDGEIFNRIAAKLNRSLTREEFKPQPFQRRELKPQTIRFEEGLRATFAPALFDQGVRMQHNPHLSQLAKEPFVRLHPNEGKKRNLETGDRVALSANGATIHGKIKLDPKVAERTLVLPLGFDSLPVADLKLNYLNGSTIEVKHA